MAKPHTNLGEWAQGLREASFRGVPFIVDTSEETLGRRGVKHEYPGRDTPYVEDLGRRGGEHTIEAFVLGDNYMAARDALRAALTKEGPGTLVHPTLGTLWVSVIESARMRETTAEGGMARFTITFTEAGENAQPAAATDSARAVETAADDAMFSAQENFSNKFGVSGSPDFVATAAVSNLEEAVRDLRSINGRISSTLSPISNFSAQLDRLGSQLTTLIQTPATLAAELAGVVTAIKGVATDVRIGFAACRTLFSFGSDMPAVPTTTPARVQQAENQSTTQGFVRQLAAIEAARISARADYASRNDADSVRDWLLAAIDTQANSADAVTGLPIDDALYQTLSALRAAVNEDLTVRGAKLPRITYYTPHVTLPALVIAYRLYGDAARADEIVARNHIRHPGFVPGGVALEVLDA